MTTISRSTRRNRTPSIPPLLAIVFVAVLVAVVIWRDALHDAFWSVLSPVSSAGSGTVNAGETVFSRFASNAELARENERLRTALATTSAALLDRDLLYKENAALKEELGRKIHGRLIIAAVINRPPGTPYDSLIIDAGAKDGVSAGDAVLAGGGSAIGSIGEVFASRARVTLFSAPGITHSGTLHTSGGKAIPITAEGEGGGSVVAEVPSGTNAKPGDSIVLAGITPTLTGIVSHVQKEEGSSFEVIRFSLPVNIFELPYVYISGRTGTIDAEN